MHKVAPGHKGKNRRFKKKFQFAFAAKKGAIHEGVIHEGVIHEALQYLR